MFCGWLLPALLILFSPPVALAADYARERQQLIREIHSDVLSTSSYIGRKSFNENVMSAIGRVPRHRFVPPEMLPDAYDNRPLPIGYGQTISQPYIVALMTDLLQPEPHHRVLEIGTGSGYQAAVLSGLVAEVKTLEIIDPLGQQAKRRLASLGYDNVEAKIGDGYYGWMNDTGEDEEGTEAFDSIIVTAAASHIPPPLIRQLKPGGVLVIPVGSRFQVQQLTLVEKSMNGAVTTRQILPVRFVPLTGIH
jgi:protein-L-isoaspartate(D-aspartate) O-methyltransferase